MDKLQTLLKDSDFAFTGPLHERSLRSGYAEGIQTHALTSVPAEKEQGPPVKGPPVKEPKKDYASPCACIFSEFDPFYATLPPSETSLYLQQKLTEICSQMDDTYADTHLNPKILRQSLVQASLLGMGKTLLVAGLMYLNEYYQRHFHVVWGDKVYRTSLRKYEPVYLHFERGRFSIRDLADQDGQKQDGDIFEEDSQRPFVNDTSLRSWDTLHKAYRTTYEPIGKYTAGDLKQRAIEQSIPLKDPQTHKNRTKAMLYEQLILKEVRG